MLYDAFISYRHMDEDSAIAEKLQELLEKYKIKDPETGEKRHLKIVRDTSEFSSSDDLWHEIEDSLDQSNYLIIIYSATTKDSEWCMRELKHFKAKHGNTNKHILPLIIDKEPKDVFPDELLYVSEDGESGSKLVKVEPLCADVRADSLEEKKKKLSKTEHMRIAAPILGLKYDDLYQRQQRILIRNILIIAGIILFVIAAFALYSFHMVTQLNNKQKNIVSNESDRIADIVQDEDDRKYAITTALNTEELLSNENVKGEKLDRTLKSKLIEEEITEQRDVFHLKSTIKSNINIWINDIYDNGSKIAIYDWNNTLLYDIENGNLLFSVNAEQVYFNDDASQCVTYRDGYSDETYTLKLYDTKTGKVTNEYECSKDSNVNEKVSEIMKDYHSDDWSYFNPAWTENNISTDYSDSQIEVIKGMEHLSTGESNGCKIKGCYSLGNRFDCYEATDPYQEPSPVFYIVDEKTSEIVKKFCGGEVCYEPDGNQLIHHDDNILEIYSINEDNADYIADYKDYYGGSLLSEDGSRFMELVSTEEYGNLLRYGEVGCQAPKDIDIDSLYYTNSSMDKIAYITNKGYLIVVDFLTGEVCFSRYIASSEKIGAIAINEDASVVAVAVDKNIYFYRLTDGQSVFSMEDCLPGISCLEFSKDMLLISSNEKTCIIPFKDKIDFKEDEMITLDMGGGEAYSMPKYLTEDGLLFVTFFTNTPYTLKGIINLKTMENCMPMDDNVYRCYAYDSDSSILILIGLSENSNASEIMVYKRNENGEFEKLGTIVQDMYGVNMRSDGNILDDNMLLLDSEDSDVSEIYDVSTQTLAYKILANNLYIKNGCIYNLESIFGKKTYKFNLNTSKEKTITKAKKIITSSNGIRTLTKNEKKTLSVDGDLYESVNNGE